MKAVQLSRLGSPEGLQLVEASTPEPHAGEVRVRIAVAGVNYFETLVRRGLYGPPPALPMIPGVEVAGVIDKLGVGVDESLLGARVAVPMFAAGRGSGGYAEYLTIDASSAFPIPDALSFEDAVALLVQGLSAYLLVRQSPPKDKTVLITAAAGGVGSLLLQLVKRAGAKTVIAGVGSAEKAQIARSLGADQVVDYNTHDWPQQINPSAELIYEIAGGSLTAQALQALALRGEMTFAALNRFELGKPELERLLANNQSLQGFALQPLLDRSTLKQSLTELFQLATAGELRILRGGRYPLAQATEAHRALESRATTGKIVLIP